MARVCAAPGCSDPVNARGFCPKHYQRWKRTGKLTADILPHDPFDVRFWRLVDRRAVDECWLWLGNKTRGYGAFRVDPRHSRMAHRIAYELLVGPIEDGLQLDHLCRNASCVNPAHLEPVTSRENIVRERAARGHCPKGHPYDAANTSVWGGRRYCRTCRNAARRVA